MITALRIACVVCLLPTFTVTPADAPSSKESRDASQILAEFDAKLAEWDAKITKEKDPISKIYRRDAKALCAWQAAQAAVHGCNYKAASAYLTIMETHGQTWIGEEGAKKGALVRKLSTNLNSVAIRMEFANGFWIANPNALGTSDSEALGILVDTLKLPATHDERLALYQQILVHTFAIPDMALAAAYTEHLCNDFAAQPELCASALSNLALHYKAQGQSEKATETFNKILTNYPSSQHAGSAHISLSEIRAAARDEVGMLKHLELAIKTSATNHAVLKLGLHYFAKKEFAIALAHFRVWQIDSDCGNCMAQLTYERDHYTAQCLVELGKTDEALEQNLMPYLLKEQSRLSINTEIPALVVQLFESRKDLDGLLKTLRPAAESKKIRLAEVALGLAEIRKERHEGKIDALAQRLRHSGSFCVCAWNPHDNWEAPAAVQALSELNGKEYQKLLQLHETLLTQMDREETYGRLIWVLHAMARSQNPEAKEFMIALRKKAELSNVNETTGVGVDDARYFVKLSETNGLKTLK